MNQTVCADFPTGVELAEDRGPETAPEKIPHKDRAPEDDSRTKCRNFRSLSPVTLTVDLDIRTRARFLYNAPDRQVSSSYV